MQKRSGALKWMSAWTAAGLSLWAAGAFAQNMAAQPGAATRGADGAANGLGEQIEKETQGLAAPDYADREKALERLRGLIGEQTKQRAQIQAVMDALSADLEKQEKALALVGDSEAEARVAGLLEMERGIAGFAAQTMGEPADLRKKLLDWGLSAQMSPVVARVYGDKVRVRVDGVAELAKTEARGAGGAGQPAGKDAEAGQAEAVNFSGVDWTLAKLINDREEAVRGAAMAACWDHKPSAVLVAALWYRAVEGPLEHGNSAPMGADMDDGPGAAQTFKVDFPGGDPLQFGDDASGADFDDGHLACDVLIHFDSGSVRDQVKAFVAQRIKTGKDLGGSFDTNWTLTTHRLVEAYGVKEAIPLLASEAVGTQSDEVGGDAFSWTPRTLAIGILAKMTGQDANDFQLIHVRNPEDMRAWIWAVQTPPFNMRAGGPGGGEQPVDGAAVLAFYKWWKDHHAEYGVKEAPSTAGLPQPGGRGAGIFLFAGAAELIRGGQ